MPDVSLHGRVAPKSKSINVEANLLAERMENQRRVQDFLRQRTLALLIVILGTALLIPPLKHASEAASIRYQKFSAQDKLISARFDAFKQQQDSEKPIEQDVEALTQIHRCARQFVGQTILFLNQVNPNLFLNSLSIEAKDRRLKFTAQAEASSYDAAKSFLIDLGASSKTDKDSQTNLLQMNSDGSFWPDGINFAIEHQVTVGMQ